MQGQFPSLVCAQDVYHSLISFDDDRKYY